MRFLSTVSIPLIGWAILSIAWPAPAEAGTSFGVNRIRYVEATGNSLENCQSLRDTLSSITDNSELIHYLVRLEPGTYNCQEQSLVVGSGIALIGSGKEQTRIMGNIDNNLLGVVHLAGSEIHLQDLGVYNYLTFTSQKSIGVSINTVFSSGSEDTIELRNVGIHGGTRAVYAHHAGLEVWSSRFTGGPVQHDTSTDPSATVAQAFFYYSILPGVQGTGTHVCRFSGTETGDFGLACEHPDTN